MRFKTMVSGKIHRARVTAADLHYVGSITVDLDLLDAAGIEPFERVQVVDIDNGARLETYTIAGARGSGEIQLNGAAARLVNPGDLVIIMAYQQVLTPVADDWHPRVVLVDPKDNSIRELITDRDHPHALRGATLAYPDMSDIAALPETTVSAGYELWAPDNSDSWSPYNGTGAFEGSTCG